jgi:hypothetical protein
MPESVSMTITATNQPENSPQKYQYTVMASLRPDAQGPPEQTTANSLPLLVLGGTGCGAEDTTGLRIADTQNFRVFGDVGVNALDAPGAPPPCSAMIAAGAARISAANVWLREGGTCTPPTSQVCQVTNQTTTPIADPLAGSAAACSASGVNPTPSGTPPRYTADQSIFHQPLSILADTQFEAGTYVFCQGVTVSNGATVSVAGDDPDAKVTWYSPQHTASFSGGAQVYISRLIAQKLNVEGETTGVGIGTQPPVPLEITAPDTETLPNWTVGRPYPTQTIEAEGGIEPYAWNITGLPAGLTADDNIISGTPTEFGGFVVIVEVFDSAGGTDTRTYGLTIGAFPTVNAASPPPDWTVNRDYPQTQMVGDGGTTPYRWSATGLPDGLQLSTAGLITGTPTRVGTYNPTFWFVDAAGARSPDQSFRIDINPRPDITSGPLPNFVAGLAYPLTTLLSTGGTQPLNWVASNLPSGLTLDLLNGQVTGTANLVGTYRVSITVEDAAGASDTITFDLRINRQVGILTPLLANGEVGAPYDQRIDPVGGVPRYSWSSTGLPPGLGLNPTDRRTTFVRGTPTQAGTFAPRITVRDGTGLRVSRDYELNIVPAPTITAPAQLDPWTVNRNYPGTAITVSDGTAPFSWSATGLPPGMSINGGTGVITGEPTTSGIYSVQVTARDALNVSARRTYSLVVNQWPTISTNSIPQGQQAIAYSATLDAALGTTPYRWAASGLPPGLTMNPNSGVLSGTPSTSGTFFVQFTATDIAGAAATKQLTLVIAPPPTIGSSDLPDWTVDRQYPNTQLAASGGTPPFTWSATGLPTGLTINGTGMVSGTPTETGTFNVVATVTDANNATATQNYDVVISGPPEVETSSLPDGEVGVPYSVTMSGGGGTAPLTWSAAGLPAGLSIAPATGVISGSPLNPGTFNVTVAATDTTGASGTSDMSLVIGAGALVVTGTSPNSAPQGATNQNISVTGSGFVNGAGVLVDFSDIDIEVNSVTFVSATLLTVNISILPSADVGPNDVTVTNGDGETATATAAFNVTAGP